MVFGWGGGGGGGEINIFSRNQKILPENTGEGGGPKNFFKH